MYVIIYIINNVSIEIFYLTSSISSNLLVFYLTFLYFFYTFKTLILFDILLFYYLYWLYLKYEKNIYNILLQYIAISKNK